MDNNKAKELIDKYVSGKCTAREKAMVETWFNQLPNAGDGKHISDFASMDERIRAGLPEGSIIKVKSTKLWSRVAAAASIIICLGIGLYFYQRENSSSPVTEQLASNDILPAGNKAFLTLANGKKISLTDAASGSLANEFGVTITKAADGQLVYSAANNTNSANTNNKVNVIETPNGGKYQVVLPDGSKVWLNAASSLKYASNLGSGDQRMVELTGEGYFEVSKLARDGVRLPFYVKTASQQVEVLGTHFNINAYGNEPGVSTTLLEGSVRVSSSASAVSKVLKPNQQSLVASNNIKVKEVDVETAMAWKNNLFLFYHVDLKSIMRQLERWYDVEVDMNTIPDKEFYGEIPRDVKLSEVLTMLEQTSKLKFKMEGRRVMLQR